MLNMMNVMTVLNVFLLIIVLKIVPLHVLHRHVMSWKTSDMMGVKNERSTCSPAQGMLAGPEGGTPCPTW